MSLPELAQLQAFLAVASTLHFGTAADQLHVTQSTVSHRIRSLEQGLGLRLFDRSRRRVTLTAAGRAYHQRVEGLLSELHQAAHDARAADQGALGRLVVGYSGTPPDVLLDAVATVARAAPRVRIELRRAGLQEQIEGLLSAELELGCTFLPLPARTDGLTTATLPTGPLSVWVASDHPLATAPHLTLDDLSAERCVVLSERAEAGFSAFVRSVGLRSSAPPLEVDSLSACLGLVRRGLGVAVLPDTELARCGLRRVPLQGSHQEQCHLLWSDRSGRQTLAALLRALGLDPSSA